MLEERVSNHRHQRMTMKAVPRPSLEVVEPELLSRLDSREYRPHHGARLIDLRGRHGNSEAVCK